MQLHFFVLFFGVGSAIETIKVLIEGSDGTFKSNTKLSFNVIRLLGEGAGGFVYLVTCKKDIHYALKYAKTCDDASPLNEWMASKRIKNNVVGKARIVKTFAWGKIIGKFQIDAVLMEYLKTKNLYEIGFINQKVPLSVILSVGRELVNCLEILSNSGILHMDVKPENIHYDLITGELTLIDLGLSYYHKSIVWVGAQRMLGTSTYMSPSIHKLEVPDDKVDIRSMIYMLAEPRYGKLPWDSLCDAYESNKDPSTNDEIIKKKDEFESDLQSQNVLGPELISLFTTIRDKVLKTKVPKADYEAIRKAIDTLSGQISEKEVVTIDDEGKLNYGDNNCDDQTGIQKKKREKQDKAEIEKSRKLEPKNSSFKTKFITNGFSRRFWQKSEVSPTH